MIKVIKLEEEKKIQEKNKGYDNIIYSIIKNIKNYKKLKKKTKKTKRNVSKCKNLVINPKHKEFKECIKTTKKDLNTTEKHIDKKIISEKERFKKLLLMKKK